MSEANIGALMAFGLCLVFCMIAIKLANGEDE